MREPWDRPLGADVGRVVVEADASVVYEEHLLATTPHRLDGIKVVVDCANGAASFIAPDVYERAGAQVIAIHSSPDGLNINENCGSTHLGDLQAAVREHKADLGIAHDGDADRCLAVDAEGNVIDGDHILAILAIAMRDSGKLTNNTVVATVMSNLGFKIAMQAHDITVIETGVGDRYVLEAMKADQLALGGEQSGHVVMLEHATTGDGLLTALHLMARMAQSKESLAQLASRIVKLPQVLVNVRGVDKSALTHNEAVNAAVLAAELELGAQGRVLLRSSGTEPVIRVMVEAQSEDLAQRITDQLAAVVLAELSLG
jgi:phosphoglucosamine mutase